jgi:BBSome-interacting protein 1
MSDALLEVLPKAGLVYSERSNLTEVLCKPKLLPIKSRSLTRLEKVTREATDGPAAADSSTGSSTK